MTAGAKATKHVVQAAAAFVMTTNDFPLPITAAPQVKAWEELCWALQGLQDMVASNTGDKP